MEAKIPLKQSIAESFGFLKAPLFTESLPPAWSISCKYNAGTYDIESIDRVGLGGPLSKILASLHAATKSISNHQQKGVCQVTRSYFCIMT